MTTSEREFWLFLVGCVARLLLPLAGLCEAVTHWISEYRAWKDYAAEERGQRLLTVARAAHE